LMVVVGLVGILASIGIASFRAQLAASKSSEAASVIQAIRGAQESFRAENQQYLDVSGTRNRWYPVNSFGSDRYDFRQETHEDYERWQRLGVNVTQPVQFRFLVTAGSPAASLPLIHSGTLVQRPPDPWFVIQARADVNGDSVFCDAVAVSYSSELFLRNEGE
ncbi:MAG TPA: type II secretion system protein, partial [Polyangiaceae bacterium]